MKEKRELPKWAIDVLSRKAPEAEAVEMKRNSAAKAGLVLAIIGAFVTVAGICTGVWYGTNKILVGSTYHWDQLGYAITLILLGVGAVLLLLGLILTIYGRRIREVKVILQEPYARPYAPEKPAQFEMKSAPAAKIEAPLTFSYMGYSLYTKNVQLKGGGEQRIYFFSKRIPKSGKQCAMPAGYKVGVNERTGLPYLKKA